LVWPLFPPLDDPELKSNAPLPPVYPALALRIVTVPLVVAVPSPLDMLKAPPVWTEERPEYTAAFPPVPLVPLPTVAMN
jgi:hypothetical protein